MKPAEHKVTWDASVLDSGRMLLIKVSMAPEAVQAEVRLLLAQAASRPMKGFRAGKISESATRRIYGKRALDSARDNLIASSHKAVVAAEADKRRFDAKKAPPPTNVRFSEEVGLSYEICVTGLSLPVAPLPAEAVSPLGVFVDFRPKKES